MSKRVFFMRVGAALMMLIWLSGGALADGQQATSELPKLGARAAVLIDGASGRVLYGHNELEQLPMASTTKVMTALLALENCALDEIVTAGKHASGVPGTSIYLREGEQLTMEQMLMGLMLRSGNDAAVAIGEHVAGSVEQFAALMNERAQALGAQAHFVTPNGLDQSGHSISALGLALVARQAMTLPDFRRIVSLQKATIPWPGNEYDRALSNKNRLLREYEGATGIKTGFTSKAGRCLVFSAQREDMELIGVVLNCGSWFDSAAALLDWGFANYSLARGADAGETAAHVPVKGGEQQQLALLAQEAVAVAVSPEDHWRVVITTDALCAPIQAGAVCGSLMLEVNGEEVAATPLIAAESIDKWDFWTAFRRVLLRF